MASNIVVLGFKNQYGAEVQLEDIQKWQQEALIELEDAVIATRSPGSDVQIEQTHKQGGRFALRGGGAGLLAGLLLGGPILGLVGGVAAGGIAGALKDYGLDDTFVKEVSRWVQPGTSALFLLVKEAKADEVLEKLRPHGAIVLQAHSPPSRKSAFGRRWPKKSITNYRQERRKDHDGKHHL